MMRRKIIIIIITTKHQPAVITNTQTQTENEFDRKQYKKKIIKKIPQKKVEN